MKSVLVGWMLGVGLLLSHVGCCSVRMVGGGCNAGTCGSGWSDECDTLGCDTLGCDTMGLGGRMTHFAGIGNRVANHIRSKNCSSGCGEIYWDEQINEPPVCDPCGAAGDFTGDTCRSCPTTLRRLRNLWNHQRYEPSNCDSCSSCGGDAGFLGASTCSNCSAGSGDADAMHGNSESTQSVPAPATPAPATPSPAMPAPAMPTPSAQSNPSRRSAAPQNESSRTQSTPSVRTLREAPTELRRAPAPVPDPNAMIRTPSQTGMVVGSGATNKRPPAQTQQVVKARPVSSSGTQSVQGKQGQPRMATSPRQ